MKSRTTIIAILTLIFSAGVAAGQESKSEGKEKKQTSTSEKAGEVANETADPNESPLVKAARESKETRDRGKSNISITNKDVEKSAGKLIQSSTKPLDPLPPVPDVDRPTAESKALEKARANAKEADIAKMQKNVDDLERELRRIEETYYNEDDPDYREDVLAKNFDDTKAQLDAARKELAAARKGTEAGRTADPGCQANLGDATPIMMDKTFFIETWGCQMNDLDTQRLSGQLKLRGYERVGSQSDASLILLNTCSIRETSEQKVLSHIGRLRDEKSRGAMIGVCGCVAQQEGQALLDRSPMVDFVMGPGNVGRIDEILKGNIRLAVDFPEQREYDYLSIDRPSAVRAQVTIIEGCNKNCTFCIVPTTRGREVSRTFDQILAEVSHAVISGHIEIELLGQTVNAYQCPETQKGFAELLEAVAEVPGVLRVRFVTSHPAEVSARMIEVIRDHANICRYLHLPVQSGSSSVLRRMKRLYTREQYLEVIEQIRSEVPDIRFSTDIIVGFPGESDEDFEETITLLDQVRYGSIFAFKYSPRPGTAALRLGDPVEESVATERIARVFEVQSRIEREILSGYRGRTLGVLHEGPSRHDPGVYSGKTEDNWTVNFRAEEAPAIGSLLEVRISEAKHHSLFGELVG